MRIALLAFLLAAAPAAAQTPSDTLRPGSPALRTAHYTDREDAMEFIVDGVAGPVIVLLTTRLGERDGVPVITRTERMMEGRTVFSTDSFVVVRATLAPVLLARYGSGRSATEFRQGEVLMGDGHRPVVTHPLSAPVFLGAAMDLLLGALPLEAGYTAALPVWEGTAAVVARVRVAGVEPLAMPAGTRSAWRIEVRESDHAGTYWLDQESRTLLRYDPEDGEYRLTRRRGGAVSAPATIRTR
jgi:hypothetical protein